MENDNGFTRRHFLSLAAKGIIISTFLPSAIQATVTNLSSNLVVSKNTNKFLLDTNLNIRQLKLFTDVYKRHADSPKALREVECLKVQYPLMFCDMENGDLFAGRERKPAIGFMPQSPSGFGYYYEAKMVKALKDDPETTLANKAVVDELIQFWNCAFRMAA